MFNSALVQVGYWRRELAAAETASEPDPRRIARARARLAEALDAFARTPGTLRGRQWRHRSSETREEGIEEYSVRLPK